MFLVNGLCSCCQSARDQGADMVCIAGFVKQPPRDYVVLEHYTRGTFMATDTCMLSSEAGFFFLMEEKDDDYYALNFSQDHQLPFIVGARNQHIRADFSQKQPAYQVSGITEMQDVFVVQKIINFFKGSSIHNQKNRIQGQVAEVFIRMEPVLDGYDSLDTQSQQALKTALLDLHGCVSALLIAREYLDVESHLPFYQQLYDQASIANPSSPLVEHLHDRLEMLTPLAPGKAAPEFSLLTPSGTEIRLSDFRGEVILVDFWAAWCKPCRENHPELRALYKRHHDKGFTIIGVSLDRSRDQWLQAIEEDSLEWMQVSDLLYFESPVLEAFHIAYLPANLLLDPQGLIIARNIPVDSLEIHLEDRLGL